MKVLVTVHVEIEATREECPFVSPGRGDAWASGYDTTPLASKVEKTLRSEFGARVLSVGTDPADVTEELSLP